MPFTFAHPAIVMPLRDKLSKWFDSTALILGSMAPDFEYFIRFEARAIVGHTIAGFLYFNLPLIFIVALLWHYVIKEQLILSLPPGIQRYIPPLLFNKWRIKSLREFAIFVMSGIIGMASHVLWDSFTHANAYFVSRISILSQNMHILGTRIGVYKVLQHGSTLSGLGIIFVYLYFASRKMNREIPKIHRGKQFIYWLLVIIMASGVLMFRAFYTLENISLNYYGIYIVSLISGTIIGISITSLIFKIFRVYEFDMLKVL